MAEARFHVPEIHCGGCVETIRKSISVLSGISTVDADIDARQVRVEYDSTQTTPESIRQRIETAGFDVE